MMLPQVISFLTALAHAATVLSDPSDPTGTGQYVRVNLLENPRLRYWYNGTEFHSRPPDGRDLQRRFIDDEEDKPRKMAVRVSTTTETSFYDYILGKEDSEDEKDGDEDYDDEEDDGEADDDDYYDEEIKKDEKKPPFLRGGRRKHVKALKIVFPLLMAYKLKFFTMLPLLVGSLALLVGTTGIAGFFFALFSAALGLHVKPHYH